MEPKRPIPDEIWDSLPVVVREYIQALEKAAALVPILMEQVKTLSQRVEELEARLNKNSGNSNKPPSSDGPFKNPDPSRSSQKKLGAQKGHKGHKRMMLDPSDAKDVKPTLCPCGSHNLNPCPEEPFYVHQVIELPEIRIDVTHFRLFKTTCRACGRTVKGHIPREHRTGYGPRLCALVSQLSGTCGESRETVRDFVQSVLGVPISTGGIQLILDRASAAIEPVYEAIAHEARNAPVNHVDETSWKTESRLKWLWVMANQKVAFFMIHKNRSYEAFCQLVDAWEGILVSDGYALYRKWVHLRQACLAHLIRHAKGLAERSDPEIARFGKRMLSELSLLSHFAREKPNLGQWRAFYARFVGELRSHSQRKDAAGVFARRLTSELDCLWVFLMEKAVDPTNNHAERCLRFGVLLRKRSLGTQSEKGERWVERILSVKQTCRINGIPVFPVLARAISDYLKDQPTNLAWIANLG